MATYNHVSGGEIEFGGAAAHRGPWHNVSGGEAVFGGGAAARGPWYNVSGGEIVFEGGAANQIDRGGGQSTVQWDFVRGKRRSK